MSDKESSPGIEYRVDMFPADVGISLARVEKDVDGEGVDLSAEYIEANNKRELLDCGYKGEGGYMRAIVAPLQTLQKFFPAHVDTSRPYVRTIYTQQDIIELINDPGFIKGRESGLILESGIAIDGSHHIATPIFNSRRH